mmetsp:Transcript_2379/g.3431  ORF Transcript_2379/g.3431 Transcript_2379/m.3431 type:complete len:393 (-) Transcript_2379:72-1250(-)
MSYLSEIPSIVCDNGTGFVKVGVAGENFPRFIYPSLIGRPILRAEEVLQKDIILKDIMCGDLAAAARGSLDTTYPVENGIIKNWDDMEELWKYTFFEKMCIDPSNTKILLTEPPLNPLKNRQKMCERMFEGFGFNAVNVSIQAILTLYAQGLQTGVVVDTGDGVSHIIPVYNGFVPQNLICRLDVAGRHITRYLIKLLLLRGYAFNRTADFETVRQIKEKLCYVAADISQERRLAQETTVLEETYELPDGREIKVGRERFEAPEPLFNPSLVDVEKPGLGDMVFEMIQKADMDCRADYYKHIVLSGGTSMYPGFSTRLESDIRARYVKEILKGDNERAKKFKLHIEDPPRRKHMVFMGGSILADVMKAREDFWCTRSQWYEEGARAISKFGG